MFWHNVNNIIKQQNKTQKSVSLECGFSERRIHNLSSSGRLPDVEEAFKIAQALNTSIEYLITGEDRCKCKDELSQFKEYILEIGLELVRRSSC